MSGVLGAAALVLHAALVLAGAPVLAGALRLARARLEGRRGPPVLQVWRDLVRLSRKRPVLAQDASWVFTAAPGVCAAATAAAALLVPSFALGMATAPLSDLLAVAGLLALARYATALAAMDAGTSLGGMGAGRVLAPAALAEPALVLVAFAPLLLAGTTNLDAAAGPLREAAPGAYAPLGLGLAATAAVALWGAGRAPPDDPAAPHEPALVHAALALDHSGRHLALLEYAAALRLLVWLDLIACLFLPWGLAPAVAGPLAWATGALAWTAKLAALALGLLALEAGTARTRVAAVPEGLGLALLLALLAAVLLFVGQSGA